MFIGSMPAMQTERMASLLQALGVTKIVVCGSEVTIDEAFWRNYGVEVHNDNNNNNRLARLGGMNGLSRFAYNDMRRCVWSSPTTS